jgi:cytochrome c
MNSWHGGSTPGFRGTSKLMTYGFSGRWVATKSNFQLDIEQPERKMQRVLIAAALSIVAIGAASAQDLAAGATSFKKCGPCHDVGPTAKNKVGPVLNGLDGRKSGSIPGYNYSDANKGSGITWNEATFLEYIKDPKAKIPNTKMTFAGIKNEDEAKNLWAYLRQYDADGKTK